MEAESHFSSTIARPSPLALLSQRECSRVEWANKQRSSSAPEDDKTVCSPAPDKNKSAKLRAPRRPSKRKAVQTPSYTEGNSSRDMRDLEKKNDKSAEGSGRYLSHELAPKPKSEIEIKRWLGVGNDQASPCSPPPFGPSWFTRRFGDLESDVNLDEKKKRGSGSTSGLHSSGRQEMDIHEWSYILHVTKRPRRGRGHGSNPH